MKESFLKSMIQSYSYSVEFSRLSMFSPDYIKADFDLMDTIFHEDGLNYVTVVIDSNLKIKSSELYVDLSFFNLPFSKYNSYIQDFSVDKFRINTNIKNLTEIVLSEDVSQYTFDIDVTSLSVNFADDLYLLYNELDSFKQFEKNFSDKSISISYKMSDAEVDRPVIECLLSDKKINMLSILLDSDKNYHDYEYFFKNELEYLKSINGLRKDITISLNRRLIFDNLKEYDNNTCVLNNELISLLYDLSKKVNKIKLFD